jgi:hypothetical protein
MTEDFGADAKFPVSLMLICLQMQYLLVTVLPMYSEAIISYVYNSRLHSGNETCNTDFVPSALLIYSTLVQNRAPVFLFTLWH